MSSSIIEKRGHEMIEQVRSHKIFIIGSYTRVLMFCLHGDMLNILAVFLKSIVVPRFHSLKRLVVKCRQIKYLTMIK